MAAKRPQGTKPRVWRHLLAFSRHAAEVAACARRAGDEEQRYFVREIAQAFSLLASLAHTPLALAEWEAVPRALKPLLRTEVKAARARARVGAAAADETLSDSELADRAIATGERDAARWSAGP
jgi:hypothetical protein